MCAQDEIVDLLVADLDAQLAAVGVPAAAVAAGADGLIIEVHHKPEEALSDGPQALLPEQFEHLVGQLRHIAPALPHLVQIDDVRHVQPPCHVDLPDVSAGVGAT